MNLAIVLGQTKEINARKAQFILPVSKMYEERIIIDPEIRHGKPVIKGTRVPVDIILGSLAGGMDIAEIARDYDIEKEDVLAALAYAAKVVGGEEIGAFA
jgi:uncharacterized protein (DUF433 family)